MPRPSDPQARTRLLAAARKVFVEKGLDRAKVEDVTHAAGLSKGAFYLHFESKTQAFTEILSGSLAEVGEIVSRGHAEIERDFEQGLEHMVAHWFERDVEIFEVIWKHRAVMALVLLEGGGSTDYQHLTETFVQRLEEQVAELFVFGIEHGYYRSDLTPATAAAFISGGFDRVARQILRAKKKPDLRTLLRQVHLYVIRAFGTPELIDVAERVHAVEAEPLSRLHGPRLRRTRSA